MRLDSFGLNPGREFPSTHNVAINFILTNPGSNARLGGLQRLPSGSPRRNQKQKPACASELSVCRRGAAMRRFIYTFVCCAFVGIVDLAAFLPAMAAATINVPAQKPTIQAGINAAASGDTVLVAPGTYYENISFNGKAITVSSSGGPAVTIIDGSKTYAPTVKFATGEKLKSVISGFTLRNGAGQISITGASPTIESNIIGGTSNNLFDGIDIDQGAPLIQGNLIAGNSNSGIYSSNDSGLQVIGNVIAGNSDSGMNIQYANGPDVLRQNSIIGNGGTGLGYFGFSGSANALVIQNLIYQNGQQGADLQAPFTMVSNTIASNSTGCCSGVELFIEGSAVTVQNNLLISADESSALFCSQGLAGSIFTNNDVFSSDGSAYSGDCTDQTGVTGNISSDPLFADALSDNFNLQSTSPAIAAGDVSALHEPEQDMDGDPRIVAGAIDIGADEYSATPALTISSYALHFPEQNVGTTSSPRALTFTNSSKTAITVSLIAAGPGFSQTNTCGASLAPGAGCQINVTFSPLTGTTFTSALGIFTNATVNPLAVTLVGSGVAGEINFCCSFYFYNQVIGATATETGTLTNGGLIPLLISSIAYSGPTDFVESNNCPIAPNRLAVASSCTVSVSFTPTLVGSESGTITVTGNTGTPSTIGITGYSVSAGSPVFSPTSLSFPTTLIGQSTAPQTLTLTNAGTGALGISGITSYGDFQQTNHCPASLGPNARCTLTIKYVPSVEGPESGFIQVITNSASFNVEAQLSGTGEAPAPTVKSLSVSSAPANTPYAQVTITGTGFLPNSQVLMDGVAVAGYPSILGSTQISFNVPTTTPGTYQVSVDTPPPGGGNSNSLPFTIYTPINYAEESTAYAYDTITGTNLGITYNGEAQITSPFPIQFGGGSYTILTIGGGGTISFSSYYSSYNGTIPLSGTNSLVAPFWANLYPFGASPSTNNNVFWEVTGTAPNRALVVEWRNVGYCCESSNTIRFEVIFHEGSGNILFNYDNTVFGGSYSADNNGATATDGIQVTSILGTQFSYNQALILSKTSQLWYPSSPTPSVSAHTLAFGYHQLDMPSTPQKVTLTNGSIATLNISSIATSDPDFAATSNCGTTLASGKSCVITVIFTPTQPSAETATLTIADNAGNSPQTIALTGIGSITSIVVYPILVNFGNVAVGSAATAPVTLANASNQRITIQSITTSPAVYAESNNCGISLAPGLSCTTTVTFTPAQAGSVQGTLSMALEGVPTKVEASLTGSGK
jgi:hypothetical protein